MQKSMFLNGQSTTFIDIRNGCHQRDPSGLEKHQTFEFSLQVDFFTQFKKSLYLRFFFKNSPMLIPVKFT